MATNRNLVEAAELFAKLPLTALAAAIEALGYESPTFEMSRMLSIQQQLKSQFEERDNMDPAEAEALYNLACELYANEDDLQTNVDPLELPFDQSVADGDGDEDSGGTWAHAWVWVPNDALSAEVTRLKKEREEKALADRKAADKEFHDACVLRQQEVALHGEQGTAPIQPTGEADG